MSLYIPRLRRAVSDFLQLPSQDTTIAFEIIQVRNAPQQRTNTQDSV